MNELEKRIYETGLVPVVKIDDPKDAPGLGRALEAGGIPIAEITFRTEAAEESIRRISAEVPGLLVGAGTVIDRGLAERAVSAGAKFIVSPGFNPNVVEYCLERGVPVFPGVNDPSAIEKALELGLSVLKFFPAEASGGVNMIDALAGPFPQVRFMPTGGIGTGNLADYARRDSVVAIGGSWMVPSDKIRSQDWDAITRLCTEAVTALQGFAFAHLGINPETEGQAATVAALFSALGVPVDERESSYFASEFIEILKKPYLGTRGHIALRTWNIDRAGAFLARHGFTPKPETAKEKNGKTIAVYLEPELAGFAVHLLKK